MNATSPVRLSDLDALLIDLGNVLVRLHVGRFLRRLREVVAAPAGDDPEVVFAEATYHRFARGELDARGFHAAFEKHLGCTWPYESFVEAWCDVFSENTASVDALRRVRGVRPLFLLSNTDVLHWESIRRRWGWTEWFDGLHLSCEVGLEKPDPRFFTTFLERRALRPERCLFVDDLEDNVAAARSVGLHAVRQETPDTLLRVVEDVLGAAGRK
ncbi:MAG: HAD family phosphatase [Deltaproteobacteria bacterium]|nr:HAD family phosphatase [Deltaproteobacteria bacterium]